MIAASACTMSMFGKMKLFNSGKMWYIVDRETGVKAAYLPIFSKGSALQTKERRGASGYIFGFD